MRVKRARMPYRRHRGVVVVLNSLGSQEKDGSGCKCCACNYSNKSHEIICITHIPAYTSYTSMIRLLPQSMTSEMRL